MASGVLERHLQYADLTSSAHTTAIVSATAFLFFVYQLLVYLGLPLLSPTELIWNTVVYICPASLLLDPKGDETSTVFPQTHAAKSEALRNLFGSGSNKVLQSISGTGAAMRRASLFSGAREPTSDAPPGLGNWDNSCYQNSVLQGLSSLSSLKTHLEHVSNGSPESGASTTAALRDILHNLSGSANNGRHIWTPAKLKSMSSWQQQDAQEYFSKIMDELDREAIKSAQMKRVNAGLESAFASPDRTAEDDGKREEETKGPQNPLEGLIAQRVACTSCGLSDGLSMIPFNCLTVPLGSEFQYSIDQCLDEYTELEDITEVECSKCTLLRAEQQLQQLVRPGEQPQEDGAAVSGAASLSLPPELRAQIAARLQAVQKALEEDDFTDKTLYETCQISKKSRVSSTKTRQAVIARGPQSLVLHVNRSVFDEMTGVQRKNHANVRYPMLLNLDPWTLQTKRNDELDQRTAVDKAALSMLRNDSADSGYRYILRAVVTHYGRHENGHYIAYRMHPVRRSTSDENKEVDSASVDMSDHDREQKYRWWRLSDEDVSPVTEEDVMAQGGVFMLLYERIDAAGVRPPAPMPVSTSEVTQMELTSSIDVHEAGLPQEIVHDHVVGTEDVIDMLEPRASIRAPPSESVWSRDTSVARSSLAGTSGDESDATDYDDVDVLSPGRPFDKISTPQWMRTAHGRQDPRDEGALANNIIRPMAAT